MNCQTVYLCLYASLGLTSFSDTVMYVVIS